MYDPAISLRYWLFFVVKKILKLLVIYFNDSEFSTFCHSREPEFHVSLKKLDFQDSRNEIIWRTPGIREIREKILKISGNRPVARGWQKGGFAPCIKGFSPTVNFSSSLQKKSFESLLRELCAPLWLSDWLQTCLETGKLPKKN